MDQGGALAVPLPVEIIIWLLFTSVTCICHLCHLYLSRMYVNVREYNANCEIVIFTPYASHPILTHKSRHFAIIGWFWLESSLHLPLSSYTGEEMQEALQQTRPRVNCAGVC